MSPAVSSTVQLTDRDLEILAWLARFRGATATQIGRRFGMGYSRASRRLNQLGAGGLVTLERVLHRRPGVYLVTAAGQSTAAADLPVAELVVGTYQHDVAVVDVAIAAELAGAKILTQRQMQALEVTDATALLYAVALPDGQRHFPDLLSEHDSERWAIEIALSDMRSEPLERVLGAYAAARHLAGVVYHVGRAVDAERIRRVAASLELGARVELRELDSGVQ